MSFAANTRKRLFLGPISNGYINLTSFRSVHCNHNAYTEDVFRMVNGHVYLPMLRGEPSCEVRQSTTVNLQVRGRALQPDAGDDEAVACVKMIA